MYVELNEVKMFFLAEIGLVSISFSGLLFWLNFLRVSDASFLGTGSHTVGWVAYNSVKNRSDRNSLV